MFHYCVSNHLCSPSISISHSFLLSPSLAQMYLEGKDETDLTANEKLILRQVQQQSIEYFPIGQAMALQSARDEEDDEVASQVRKCGVICCYK